MEPKRRLCVIHRYSNTEDFMRDVDPVERAFQLAKSGEHHSVEEIRKALNAEGRSTQAISGPLLLRQLRTMIRLAFAETEGASARL
jgi:hypothetical protein